MESFAKMMMLFGAVLFALGAALYYGGRFIGLGRLPGDIFIQRDGFSFYFPLVTCIVISVVLTLIFSLLGRR